MHLRRLPRPIFSTSGLSSRRTANTPPRVEQEIYNACNFLAAAPLRGHSRADLASSELRFRTLTRYPNYPNYTVVYRPRTTPLQIVAVLHGKRNIPRILKHR